MSAPKKKKYINPSPYDSFNGKWVDEQVNEVIKKYGLRLDDILKQNSDAPTAQTKTIKNNDLEKLRVDIRKNAKWITKPNQKQQQVPVISDVVRVKDVTKFTTDTYKVELVLKPANYYSEQITTKIVGMETVDWWEYILVYGIVKYFRIGYEYVRLKEYIDNGIQSTRTVSGQNLEIRFVPKMRNDVKQEYDTLNGQTVIREKGTIYESVSISLEIPKKSEQRIEEYRKGYFVYEDTFTTLVIDYDVFGKQIEQMLTDCGIHVTLIDEITKILKDGRLSTI